jgi:hypothetical protein
VDISSTAEHRQYRDQPYRAQPDGTGGPRPGFLTAPFEKRVWRESLHLLVNLPVGIAGFTFAVTMTTLGVGTVLTFVGLPVLAAAVLGCRAIGAMERSRARATLDLDVAAPGPRQPSRSGLSAWLKATLASGAGWRSVLYSVLMLPMGILSFTVTLTMWTFGIGYGSYPLWQWVFPRYTDMPGLQLYQNGGHTVYLSSVPQIAGVCAAGLLVLFLTPWAVRGLAAVQRGMVRGLLG